MGVQGLWSVLEDSAKMQSISALALSSFDTESKGFRLGIDASIWFFHADYGKEGENPELRTLFFRCKTLLESTIIPLFIFDGPKRPEFKRGKKINRSANKLTTGMKRIIEAFGFQHHTAPGEAEAELAYLNDIGIIDGVMTDDVDTYLFGANTIVRNPSSTHYNAKNNAKKAFVRVYRDIQFSRADLILAGLCSGGDYNQAGLPNCGIKTAIGLAKAGFSKSLFDAAVNLAPDDLPAFLDEWRQKVVKELATNASGFIGRKMAALSRTVPKSFPDISILMSYVRPITSFTEGRPEFYEPIMRNWTRKEPSLPDIAATCEFYFEWGFRESIVKRSRTVLWPGVALRVLRRYIIDGSEDGVPAMFAGNHPLPEQGKFMRKIHSSRTHETTDMTLEYRVELDPSVLVKLVEAGIKGDRRPDDHVWSDDDSDAEEAKVTDPNTPVRVWLPATLVRRACPEITAEYDEKERKKQEKKRPKTTRKKKAPVVEEGLSGEEDPPAIILSADTGGDVRDFFQAKKTVAGAKTKPQPKPKPKTQTTTTMALSQVASSSSKAPPKIKSAPISPSKVLSALQYLDTPIPKTPVKPATPRLVPRPFPIRFSPLHSSVTDEDDLTSFTDSDVEVLPPNTPSPKKTPRRPRHSSTSSEEALEAANKSPRRSRIDSPSKNSKGKQRRDASPLAGRSGTSSVLRRKVLPDPVHEEIIIISSDEEDAPPPVRKASKPKPAVVRASKPVATKTKTALRVNETDPSLDFHPLLRARALASSSSKSKQ